MENKQNQDLFNQRSAMKYFVRFIIVILCVTANSCKLRDEDGENPPVLFNGLPNGKSVQIISMGKSTTGNGEEVFYLRYKSQLAITDNQGIEQEIIDVWSAFQAQVVASGVNTGVVQVRIEHKTPTSTATRSVDRRYVLGDNGEWSQAPH